MLTIRDHTDLSRRDFVRAGAACFGGLALAELSLPSLLRAEAAAGIRSSNKAVVFVHLDGGPPHMDMIDPKPDAPAEVRGEFGSIPTKVTGLHIGELLPLLAKSADKFAFIRTLVGSAGAHDAFQCQSGFAAKDLESMGGRPALGCVVSKIRGGADDQAPAFVDLMQGRAFVRNSARPGFLGPAFQPFRPDISHLFTRDLEPGMKNELTRRGAGQATSLALSQPLTLGRIDDRTQLLSGLDRYRRDADRSGSMAAVDSFTHQAVGILTSGRFAAALDISREPAKSAARYMLGRPVERVGTSDDGNAVKKFLLARRLLEAGVRVVSLSLSDYDTHSGNFDRMRRLMPVLDCGLTAFVADLEERGMLGDVSIVAWGEFGRTPKVNKSAGRDHWPGVGMALLAGCGMKAGQVIGSTDRLASIPTSRPVHYQDVIATLYHNLGISPTATTILDPSGRPQHVVDKGQAIGELS